MLIEYVPLFSVSVSYSANYFHCGSFHYMCKHKQVHLQFYNYVFKKKVDLSKCTNSHQ